MAADEPATVRIRYECGVPAGAPVLAHIVAVVARHVLHCELVFEDGAALIALAGGPVRVGARGYEGALPASRAKSHGVATATLRVSRAAVDAMRAFADAQAGKPYDDDGAALCWLPLVWRTSTGAAWFCSELVAAALARGGLLAGTALADLDPGAVTPAALYDAFPPDAPP